MKREGISTLFIHGYPWALSYLLIILKLLLCLCVLKSFFYFDLTLASVFKSVTKLF